jgi:hypothetical protein
MFAPMFYASTVAVVALYYLWRNVDMQQKQRFKLLKERVAFLVWVSAMLPENRLGKLRKV